MTAQRDDRWLVAIVAAFVLQSEKKKVICILRTKQYYLGVITKQIFKYYLPVTDNKALLY